MKTTIDLPDDLIRELKFRAVRDRRKFKDLAAELLRSGLTVPNAKPKKSGRPLIIKDKMTGLPVIQCRRTPPRNQPTPDQIAEILLEQETDWANAST